MENELLNVGLDNMVSKREIVVLARPDSLPIKNAIKSAEQESRLVNLTRGRKTRSVIFTSSGYVVLSPLRTPTLADRYTNGG